MPRRRWPRGVYDLGSEPDPRFSFANERTFLAWLRTALALLAAGVAAQSLPLHLHHGLRQVVAPLLVALAGAAAVQAWLGWARAERALRLDRPLPSAPMAPVLAAGVAVMALVVVVVMAAG